MIVMRATTAHATRIPVTRRSFQRSDDDDLEVVLDESASVSFVVGLTRGVDSDNIVR